MLAITFFLWLLGPVIIIQLCLRHWYVRRHDDQEPPEIPSVLPGVGHLLGLIRHGLRYYVSLNSQNRLPMYTLQMLGQKMYIVNSPDLVTAVQRNTKDLSFNPFVAAMVPRLFQMDEAAVRVLKRNLDGHEGSPGLIADTHRDTWPLLALGDELDAMVSTMLTSMLPFLDELAAPESDSCTDLYRSVRRSFTIAGTDVLYGPANPFRHDPSLENAFWDFEKDATFLLLGIAPSLVARRANRARSTIFNAMQKYLEDGSHASSSPLTQARYQVYRRHGLSTDAIARLELSSIIGILINATPSIFWLLFYVFSNTILLNELREELSDCFTTELDTSQASTTKDRHVLNVARLRENAPLLMSCYRETLRLKTNSVYSRWVCSDTIIKAGEAQYLVKEGSIIQVPGASMHADPTLWGEDVNTFNSRRFLKTQKTYRPGSFRSFGGGTSVCPGRHFAMLEILSTAAIWIMRFEMTPIVSDRSGGTVEGSWAMPRTDGNDVISTISPPTSPCLVNIRERKSMNGSWKFQIGKSNKGFEVS